MELFKIGGNELADPIFLAGLGDFIAAKNEPAIIVHGGGKVITELQTQFGLPITKVDGLRVTDAESLRLTQMAMSGHANKIIVAALMAAGVAAVGLSGVDGGLLRCQKRQHPTADLGYVGKIDHVHTDLLHKLLGMGLTAVISPISLGHDDFHPYNVNADDAARAVALAMNATQLTFVSNVPGVLHNNTVLPQLTLIQTEQLIRDSVITDGMVTKVRSALTAVQNGLPKARIVNLENLANGGTIFRQSQIRKGL